MNPVTLPRPLINRILTQAQKHAAEEVCGLIGSRDGQPSSLYPVANVAAEPQRLFAMDPEQQITAMRDMREAGEELFAIYHSHPNAPAQPSAADLEQAAYSEALYLIVSLDTKGVLDLRGYRLLGGEFVSVELVMA